MTTSETPKSINLADWLVRAFTCDCRDPDPVMCAARRRREKKDRCGCRCHEMKGKADDR